KYAAPLGLISNKNGWILIIPVRRSLFKFEIIAKRKKTRFNNAPAEHYIVRKS
ncbi:MAG: hypothetical protein ACI9QN_002534, partial [Arcticibacterium sp.]